MRTVLNRVGLPSFAEMILMSQQPPSQPDKPHQVEDSASKKAASLVPKIVPFENLAKCGDELWIEHRGQLYRLRATKAGKLILTK